MFLGFLATGMHLGTVIVAGRAAALSFRHAAEEHPENRLKEFRGYFFICEQLQLTATALFLSTLLFVIFYMFSHIAYPIALYVTSGVGAYLLYRTGFWRASILVEDFRIIMRMFRRYRKQHDNETGGTVECGDISPDTTS